MSKKKKAATQEESRKFTTTKLVKYLNDTHGKKKTGEKFATNDIQQYLRRGKLPQYIGGHPIKCLKDEEIGTRILEVDFSESITRKPREKK